MVRKKLYVPLIAAMTVFFVVALGAVAVADTFLWDADLVTVNNQSSLDLGVVSPGAVITKGVSFQLQCAGKGHVDDAQTVAVTFNLAGSTVPTGGFLSATDSSIGAIPATWPDDTTGGGSTNCPSTPPVLDDNGNSTVTITAPTTPGGPYTYLVDYDSSLSPAGNNDSSAITGPSPSATFTLSVSGPPADTTPPVISYTVNGVYPAVPDGENGWYVSDVTLDWTVTDPESAFTTTGCDDTTITADQDATDYSCSATSAGGSAGPVTVTIKRDATDPTIGHTVSPASPDGTGGWYKTAPTVSFSCFDATSPGSGIAECTADGESGNSKTLGESTSAQSVGGTARDLAGNTATDSATGLYVDLSNPMISHSVSPLTPDGDNSWYITAPTVTFTCSDSISGIASCLADGELVAFKTLGENASTQTVSGTATDNAGRTNTDSVSLSVDLSDPTISHTVSPSSPDGANGWYITAPTVTFTCGDSISGIASCLADGELGASKTLGESTSAQSVGGTTTDLAGRTNTDTASGLYVDLSDPTNVAFVGGPAAGGSYYFGSVPAAPTCTADDAISGLDSCDVSGYSTLVGTHTMAATATDNAGRTATATRSYTVLAWTINGFYAPVDKPNTMNITKGGSTVPLKFEVFAGTTELTDTSIVDSFKTGTMTCVNGAPTDAIEEYATGSTSLRYDAVAGQFIFNWKTLKQPGTCWQVKLTTQDGSVIYANFNLK